MPKDSSKATAGPAILQAAGRQGRRECNPLAYNFWKMELPPAVPLLRLGETTPIASNRYPYTSNGSLLTLLSLPPPPAPPPLPPSPPPLPPPPTAPFPRLLQDKIVSGWEGWPFIPPMSANLLLQTWKLEGKTEGDEDDINSCQSRVRPEPCTYIALDDKVYDRLCWWPCARRKCPQILQCNSLSHALPALTHFGWLSGRRHYWDANNCQGHPLETKEQLLRHILQCHVNERIMKWRCPFPKCGFVSHFHEPEQCLRTPRDHSYLCYHEEKRHHVLSHRGEFTGPSFEIHKKEHIGENTASEFTFDGSCVYCHHEFYDPSRHVYKLKFAESYLDKLKNTTMISKRQQNPYGFRCRELRLKNENTDDFQMRIWESDQWAAHYGVKPRSRDPRRPN